MIFAFLISYLEDINNSTVFTALKLFDTKSIRILFELFDFINILLTWNRHHVGQNSHFSSIEVAVFDQKHFIQFGAYISIRYENYCIFWKEKTTSKQKKTNPLFKQSNELDSEVFINKNNNNNDRREKWNKEISR